MTDYAGTDVSGNAGVAVTGRTGTTNSDTVPAGCLLVVRNTGAGAHTITFTTANTAKGGLAIEDRVWNVPAAGVFVGRVEADWANANGVVPVAINGTANEVTYYVLGNV